MALARDEHALGRGLPAHRFQQFLPQRIEPLAALGRQHHPRTGRGGTCGVPFVPDVDHGDVFREFFAQSHRDTVFFCYVFRSIQAGEVVQEQHRVGGLDMAPGAFDADFFDLVLAVAQPGRVHHMQRHALDLDGLRHHVARGACHRRDDGEFRPRQRIEQRTLAGVGLAGNHHLDALAQQRALARALHHPGQRLLQAVQLALCVGLLQEVNLFLGEIERGLDQHAQVHQRVAQGVDFP